MAAYKIATKKELTAKLCAANNPLF